MNLLKLDQAQQIDSIQFVCKCVRSLTKEIRIKSSQVLKFFKSLDESYLTTLIVKEKFEEFNTLNYNYCNGTIIHSLEDEFNQVRLNSLDVLKEFSENKERFAKEARDIILYMLNDENDMVRTRAIQIMTEIYKNIEISDKELVLIVFNIIEENLSMRYSIYKFLENVKIQNAFQLQKILEVLWKNLSKFSKQDEYCIYNILKQLGINNSKFILDNITTILQISDIQFISEPVWNEPVHITRMILIQNAVLNQEIQQQNNQILPVYFEKHIGYLNDFLPDMFSQILKQTEEQKTEIKTKHLSNNNINNLLLELININIFDKNSYQYVVQLQSFVSKEKSTDLHLFYLKLAKVLKLICLQKKQYMISQISQNEIQKISAQIWNKILKLISNFNMSQPLKNYLTQLQFQALFMAILSFNNISQSYINFEHGLFFKYNEIIMELFQLNFFQELMNSNKNKESSLILQQIHQICQYIQQNPALVNFQERIVTFNKLQEQFEAINNQNIFVSHNIKAHDLFITKKYFKIIEPLDKELQIKSKYLASFKITMSLENIDLKNHDLGILISFSDNSKEIYRIFEEDKKVEEKYLNILKFQISLKKLKWTSQIDIGISLVDLRNNQHLPCQQTISSQDQQNTLGFNKIDHTFYFNLKQKFEIK